MTADPAGSAGEFAAARHGSYCPKLCTFACPVTEATGRDDAVPWSFHRTLTDLADGRLPAGDAAARRMSACSGCLACQVPCEFDQDVPAQVRAGRALLDRAGTPVGGTSAAVDAVAAGRSPFGGEGRRASGSSGREGPSAEALVLAGCRDEPATVQAAIRLLAASGTDATATIPRGCCGATLADLGAEDAAADARRGLEWLLTGHRLVLVLDPHCLPTTVAAAPRATVRNLVEELAARVADGALGFHTDPRDVTYHDPCLLARRDGVTTEPRRLLEATGARLVEPERHGTVTACSGAGLALELVDPDAARATATKRRRELERAGGTVVTGCSGAGASLTAADGGVTHLVRYLADHLSSPA